MIVLWILLAVYLFWPSFIFYAGVTNNWDKFRPWQRAYFLPFALPFGALDVAINYTVASLLFLQFPEFSIKQVTLTRRMIALKAGPDGWRKQRAVFICANMCDLFQQGHC